MYTFYESLLNNQSVKEEFKWRIREHSEMSENENIRYKTFEKQQN